MKESKSERAERAEETVQNRAGAIRDRKFYSILWTQKEVLTFPEFSCITIIHLF